MQRAAFDVADTGKVRSFFESLPRLDILVNNAISMTPKPFAALEPSDFAATYASSVTAAFETVRAARSALRVGAIETGDASVINIASMYGLGGARCRASTPSPDSKARSTTVPPRRRCCN